MRRLSEVGEEWKEDEEVVKSERPLQRRHRESVVQKRVTELSKRSLLSAGLATDVSLKFNDRSLVKEVEEAVEVRHPHS